MKSVKFLFLFACMFYSSTLFSQISLFLEKIEVPGYFITERGDSLLIIFKLVYYSNKEDPGLVNFAFGLKYKDVNGKKGKITPENTKEFGYTYENKKVRVISVVEFYPPDPMGYREFRQLEIDDYLSLYSYEITGSQYGSGTYYEIKKADAGFFRGSYSSNFKDEICEYLKEDTDLVRRIQNRELKYKDIEQIVREYNRWFKYERNNK